MKNVLILNHKVRNCGVYQFGKRVYDLASESKDINYIYRELDSLLEYYKILNEINADYILYNWHRGTMSWLSEDMVLSDTGHKHLFMFHEEFMRYNYDRYLFFGDYDIGNRRIPADKSILLPRPLLNYNGEYSNNNIINIGSFGFAFWNKGLHKLVKLVNDTMNNAVINIHAPYSYFGDFHGTQTKEVLDHCKSLNTNKSIELNITRDFLDEHDILKFLAKNDINIFLYDENGEGISSVVDYALSVRRPIAISNCNMFRHIIKDDILIDKHSIVEIINNGVKPLEEFYDKWSTDKFKKEIDEVFLNV